MSYRKSFWITFCIFLIISFGSMFIASQLTTPQQNWYALLKKPSFLPPAFVFPLVWTILYLCMALSGTFLWLSEKTKYRAGALTFWGLQLLFNIAWSFLFFTLHEVFLAIIDLSALWICLFFCIFLSFKSKPLSAYLLIPYIFWVSFALVLNVYIFIRNDLLL